MTDNDNMRIWNALKATDPKYTKPVTFGRKFTSINSQWQLQRMTEQFGPIGEGWGYSVAHSVEFITGEYVLAIADVTIWWAKSAEELKQSFGPVRGMSPIVEKGKNGLYYDDDAGKKAMTDALTKGLSHIGLSADVFLGLFDDNKYVQQMAKEFKEPPKPAIDLVDPQDQHLMQGDGRSTEFKEPPKGGIDLVDPLDQHLVQGDGRSTYKISTEGKAPGRTAAEFWTSHAALLFRQPNYDLLLYREWEEQPATNKGTKTNRQKLIELREKHPDLAAEIDKVVAVLPAGRSVWQESNDR